MVPEGAKWTHTSGRECWNGTSDEGYSEKKQWDDGQRNRVYGGNTKEQTLQKSRQPDGRTDADSGANKGVRHTLTHDE